MYVYQIKKRSDVQKLLSVQEGFFVHKYNFSHRTARKITRKMAAEGLVTSKDVGDYFSIQKVKDFSCND